jgi:hypothetical protein
MGARETPAAVGGKPRQERIRRGDMVPKTILTPVSGHIVGPETEASSRKLTFRNENYVLKLTGFSET